MSSGPHHACSRVALLLAWQALVTDRFGDDVFKKEATRERTRAHTRTRTSPEDGAVQQQAALPAAAPLPAPGRRRSWALPVSCAGGAAGFYGGAAPHEARQQHGATPAPAAAEQLEPSEEPRKSKRLSIKRVSEVGSKLGADFRTRSGVSTSRRGPYISAISREIACVTDAIYMGHMPRGMPPSHATFTCHVHMPRSHAH
jgi:hypothetical protein